MAAPWADVLFAMDRAFWDHYGLQVRSAGFAGTLGTTCDLPGLTRIPAIGVRNSGAGAIMFAYRYGARRVVLLGYDCKAQGNRKHWHRDHPRPLGNAGTLPKWPAQFAQMLKVCPSLEILNASRDTALDCFRRVNLEDVLPCHT